MLKLVSGCLAALSLMGASAASAQETSPPRPDAVVAIVDTGINPYHQVFRDNSARAFQHPSTYLPGYPADAEALNLTLDEPDFWTAVAVDCEVWKQVEPRKLYWVPGTKIVGAISFEFPMTPNCDTAKPTGLQNLDYGGHGTMTASRATATEYGACKECLVVSVLFPGYVQIANPSSTQDPTLDAIRWAADNSEWIDVQSNSWGPIVPAWDPTSSTGFLGGNPELARAVEEVSQKHPAFWASGNGAAFRGGVLGHPTLLSSHLTPSAISVGGHDSGQVNTWPGFPPHLVSDSCSSWAADNDDTERSAETIGGGTSAATPFVAGGAARILLEARRLLGEERTGVRDGVVARGPAGLVAEGPLADGEFTVAEFKRVLYTTASPRPQKQFEDGPPCGTGPFGPTPIFWKDVPAQYPEYLHIGYGAVDAQSHDRALAVLRGTVPLPDRSATDTYFALDGAARAALHQVFRGQALLDL